MEENGKKPQKQKNYRSDKKKKDSYKESRPAERGNEKYSDSTASAKNGKTYKNGNSQKSKGGDRGKRPAKDNAGAGRAPERRRERREENDADIRSYHNDYVAHFEAPQNSDADDIRDYGARSSFRTEREENSGIVVGRNAVRELLKSERAVDKLLVRRGDREGSIVVLVAEAVSRGIPVVETDRNKMDAIACGAPHQGVIAMAAEKEYVSVEDILEIAKERGEDPIIVIADGIADPYNLGALIRCAEGAGAHGLIIPKRHAVGLTPAVSKASAGAIEHLAIAKVSNISATVDELKKKGIWTYAAEAEGTPYYDADFSGPVALIFGSEGDGIKDNVKKKCDFVVSIPMYGQVNSFNVSTAASVLLCEAARHHRTGKGK